MEGLTLLRVESDVNGSSRVYLDTLLFFARASFSLVSSVPSILSENSMSEHLAWQETLLNPLAGSHLLKICRDEAMQAEAVAYFIKGGLLDNELVIIIARASLRNAILFHLNAMGLNVQFFKNQGQLKFLDADFLLSRILINDMLEDRVIHELIVRPIQIAHLKYGKIRAFGEMVDILWKGRQYDRALQLEKLWDELSKEYQFALFCTYLTNSFDASDYDDSLEHVCKVHSHLLPLEREETASAVCANGEAIDLFRAAWDRVVEKMSIAKQTPEMPI